MFRWCDELNNQGDRFFLKKEDCDLDLVIWRRDGYRPIGKHIQYIESYFKFPPQGTLFRYMIYWYMHGKYEDVKEGDIDDFTFLWSALSKKIPGLDMVNKTLVYKCLQSTNRRDIFKTMQEMDMCVI